MSIESEVRNYVLDDAGVLAELVANDACWREFLPQQPSLPALVYQRVSGERTPTLDGPSSFVAARIQFDAYARDQDAADALARALRLAMNQLQKTSLATIFVDSCFLESDQDLSSLEGDRRHRRVSMDFVIRYKEA